MSGSTEEEEIIATEVDDILGVKKKKCLQKRYYEEIKSVNDDFSGDKSGRQNPHRLTSEERLRNFQGIVNIIIVMTAVMVSLFLTYVVLFLVSPWWKKPLISEVAALTVLNIGLACLGVFLFFVNESFAEDFDLALDRRCSTFIIKFFVMIVFCLFLLINGLIVYIVPSVYGIIYDEEYFSRYVLEGFHRVGIGCVALAAWGAYVSFHKLATRIVLRNEMIEKDIVSFFLQKQKDMGVGDIMSISSKEIYNFLKKKNQLKCSYSRLRKCAIGLLYEKKNCKKCATVRKALQFMGKMSPEELLSIKKVKNVK